MPRTKKTPDFVVKICAFCKKEFSVKYYNRNRQLYCSKSCVSNDPVIKQKSIQSAHSTFTEKYGCHPMQCDATYKKFKQSIKDKYNVDSYSQHIDYKDKLKSTLKQRYGSENYNNLPQIKSTLLEKYGVDNPAKIPHYKEKSIETKKNNHYEYLIEFCENNNLQFICEKEQYKGYHFSNLYNFKCNKCDRLFKTTVYNLHNLFCDYCNPEKITTVENDFYNFLQQILLKEVEIQRNNRTILVGKELDFYIPNKKIAFEINGLYWHSEQSGNIPKSYHINKTKSCAFHGITLIHIFENEWINKKQIVKSVVSTLLNTNTLNKLNARDCIIKEVLESEKNIFLKENHLQGEDKSTIKIGLYYKNELVSLMTFRKTSRFDKTVEWELLRFCNKINTIINGGASKLFSYFLKNYNPSTIVSYCDRRYFNGNLYEKLGFKFVNFTVPNYYYIINNYKDLKHRMSFQKHKLKKLLSNYDEKLSEWENMKLNGYDRIWDCGNSKWIFSNKLLINTN